MTGFTVYPAIDVRDGRVVRLAQGDYARETRYEGAPLDVAARYAEQEASLRAYLQHLYDLGLGEADYRWLNPDELRQQVRMHNAYGAIYSPHCATIQPAKLVRGLAQAVQRMGVQLFERIEGEHFTILGMPLLPVLARMELLGTTIDPKLLHQQSQEIELRLAELEKQAHELAGQEFNLSSPKQLGEILFVKLGLPILKKTPKGAPSTAEEVLAELAVIVDEWVEVFLREGKPLPAPSAGKAHECCLGFPNTWMLVDDGEIVTTTRDVHPRTAVGVSKDGRQVYLV
mgnify:CR=1 FL=1